MTDTATRIDRIVSQHLLVAAFLQRFAEQLDALSYEAMQDKLGTDYDNTPHASFYTQSTGVTITAHGPDQRETMRVLRRMIGGTWEKAGYGYRFEITREWGTEDGEYTIRIDIEGDRENVCQRIVTGTSERTIPAVEAQPERTETVEEVEWVCGNLLTG